MSKWRWCYSIVSNAVVILYVFALARFIHGILWLGEFRFFPRWDLIIVIVAFFLAFFEVHRYVLQNKFDLYVHRTMLLIASLLVLALGCVTISSNRHYDEELLVLILALTVVSVFTIVSMMRRKAPSPAAMIVFPLLCITLIGIVVEEWGLYVLALWGIILAAYAFFRMLPRRFKVVVGIMPLVMFAGIIGLGFLVYLLSGVPPW